MQTVETNLAASTRVMQIIGWLCMLGLPLFAMAYAPGVLWGSVEPGVCFPQLIDHPPSPYNGLHPYFYMVAAMYVSYGFLMLRGARQPLRNVGLFDYGIAANVLHGAIMVPMAFYYPNEHAHLWFDIPFAFLVAGLLYQWHPDKVAAQV